MFSLASFLITMRETIEAALIIGILLSYVKKMGQKRVKRDIWIGTGLAIMVSVIAAFLFQFLLGGFEQYEAIIEGFMMLLAGGLLTWVIIWMKKVGNKTKEKLESKIDQSIQAEKKWGLISLAFISVLREGIETVIFLSGVNAVEDSLFTTLFSGLLGIITSIILAIIIFWSGRNVNLKYFFNITSIFLLLFAAGLIAHGFHEFQEIGWFGGEEYWLQQTVWDTSAILNDESSQLGSFMRTLFGYQDKPSWLELLSYSLYMLFLIPILIILSVNKKTQTIVTKEETEISSSP